MPITQDEREQFERAMERLKKWEEDRLTRRVAAREELKKEEEAARLEKERKKAEEKERLKDLPKPKCSGGCGKEGNNKRWTKWKCKDCKQKAKTSHKFDDVDVKEYNANEKDERKHLVLCECGRKYVSWNQHQHVVTLFHKNFFHQKKGEPLESSKAGFCTQLDANDYPHGGYNLDEGCPKCEDDEF